MTLVFPSVNFDCHQSVSPGSLSKEEQSQLWSEARYNCMQPALHRMTELFSAGESSYLARVLVSFLIEIFLLLFFFPPRSSFTSFLISLIQSYSLSSLLAPQFLSSFTFSYPMFLLGVVYLVCYSFLLLFSH